MAMTTAAIPSGWPTSCPTTDDIDLLTYGHKGEAIRPYVLAKQVDGSLPRTEFRNPTADRLHLIKPRLAKLPLDVVFPGEDEAAVRFRGA
jgi:hypothetical protein